MRWGKQAAVMVACVASAAWWGGCAAKKERPLVQYTTEPWTFAQRPGFKIVSAHYEIYTTLQDQVLRDALPDFVEAAYAYYVQLVPPASKPDERMRVYLFASRGQWEAFTKRFTGSRSAVFLKVRNGGYSERGVSVIEYVAHQITFPLFAHEGFHQYLFHHVNTHIPAWLHEGLAVYCEGQRWGATRLSEFEPSYNPARRNMLAESLAMNRLHALTKLLETDAGKIMAGSSRAVGTYYAQVWALILFLQEGEHGKYAAGFRKLLDSLRDVDIEQSARASFIWSERQSFNFGEALFRSFISDDLETVEREYVAFLRARFLESK